LNRVAEQVVDGGEKQTAVRLDFEDCVHLKGDLDRAAFTSRLCILDGLAQERRQI
jgi:hypothetical protein